MPYSNFTDYPLWKEASAIADSIFDFSREVEDFSLRNRMTAAAVEIPFMVGEAAQSESDEKMKNLLWKVEDPVNEVRSVLTECQEQGLAPNADYALLQDRCRDLFRKVHTEASAPVGAAAPTDVKKKPSPEKPVEVAPAPKPAAETRETKRDRDETRPVSTEPESSHLENDGQADQDIDENTLI